jgi:hypothetical protein
MQKEELDWLARQAKTHNRIVEIGSCLGRSSRALADNTYGRVTCVDTWGSVELRPDPANAVADFELFQHNCGDLIESDKIRPVQMKSIHAAAHFRDLGESFNMIFIDAAHDYENVNADIGAWLTVLEPGGLICGHDFYRYSGLDEAVLRHFPHVRMAPYPCSIWIGDGVAQGRDVPRSKKTIFTLNINYPNDITELTYPLLQAFATKCNADFYQITERKFPEWPVTFEKLQIFELAQRMGNEWSIYLDGDALVHPDTFDPTEHLSKDTVLHNGRDMAGNRFQYDRFFRRDGRHIGSGNWFTVASDWCVDLWEPPRDLTPAQAVAQIQPQTFEQVRGITPDHLVDDYVLSRNIAKYGLKFKTYSDLINDLHLNGAEYFWHQYTMPTEVKIRELKQVLTRWGFRSREIVVDPFAKAMEEIIAEGKQKVLTN